MSAFTHSHATRKRRHAAARGPPYLGLARHTTPLYARVLQFRNSIARCGGLGKVRPERARERREKTSGADKNGREKRERAALMRWKVKEPERRARSRYRESSSAARKISSARETYESNGRIKKSELHSWE